MPAIQASRRLVKSPPELWAEVSDAASLARHLGEVGEITITRLEPETTVAWEGEHASGTVELAPAGWGTSVTLTAEPAAAEPTAVTPLEPEPEFEPLSAATADAPTEPKPPAEPEATGIEETAPTAEPVRRGWLARLFRRAPEHQPPLAPQPTTGPDTSTTDADPAGGGEDARPPAEGPVSAPGRMGPGLTGPVRQAAEPEDEPQPALEAALNQALDSLGQAHHRPFSRG